MSAKHPDQFEDGEINSRSAACMSLLWARGGDLLEGTLELTDEWVSNQLCEALWAVSHAGSDHGEEIVIPGDIRELEDHELQDYAAAVFLKAAGQKDGCHGAFTGMEAALCADYAMRIED